MLDITKLRERLDRDQCSVPRCKHAAQVIYLPGATPANPKTWLGLCNSHHKTFCSMAISRHPAKSVRDARNG